MSDDTPRRYTGLATLGMILGLASPFVILMLYAVTPPAGYDIRREIRALLRVVALLWLAATLLVPVAVVWLTTRRHRSPLGLEVPNRRPDTPTETRRIRLGCTVALLGLVVIAIAIPGNVHGPRWEMYAAGDIRTLISGQESFRSANGRGYGTLECLAEPPTCLPGYSGPTFLDPKLLKPQRHLYVFTFHAGPAVPVGAKDAPYPGARLLSRYAYSAVPTDTDYVQTSLCGDDTGRICRAEPGAELKVTDARCPDPCDLLR